MTPLLGRIGTNPILYFEDAPTNTASQCHTSIERILSSSDRPSQRPHETLTPMRNIHSYPAKLATMTHLPADNVYRRRSYPHLALPRPTDWTTELCSSRKLQLLLAQAPSTV